MPRAPLLAACDAVLAVATLGAVVVISNVEVLPAIDTILTARITVLNIVLLAMFTSGAVGIFTACGLYGGRTEEPWRERRRVCVAVALLCVYAAVLSLLGRRGGFHPAEAIPFGMALLPTLLSARHLRDCLRRWPGPPRRVLVLGSGARALRMWQALASDRCASHELVGVVDTPGHVAASEAMRRRTIGTLDRLEETLMREAIDEVCIALPFKSQYREIQEALLVCERMGVRTRYDADMFETQVAWPVYERSDSPMVTMQVVPDDYRLAIKRLVDVGGAVAALILTAPVMASAALAIKLTSPGPVFFAQERYGRNRHRFWMFKFRTMVTDAERLQHALEASNEADGPVFKMAADPRVTWVGAFLRRTSVDELPQLFNVVRGEMSLVGPRPLPRRDVDRFTRAGDMRRFSVRPGVTCLWQISGRSTLGFDEWMALDLRYIDQWSLALDLSILLRTVPAVLRGTGAR